MKLIRGIVALLIVCLVLLFSDRQNARWFSNLRLGKNEKTLVSTQVDQTTSPVGSDGLILFNPNRFLYKPLIVEVDYNLSSTTEESQKGIFDGLKAAGLIEGENFELKQYNAQGDVATLNSIFDVVKTLKADLIITISTPTTQVALKKITDTPVVFSNVGDPVGIGVGNSFSDHHPNFTGISVMSDFEGAIEVLLKVKPGIKKIGTLFTPGESNSVEYKNRLEAEAKKRGLVLIARSVSSATEVPDALLSLLASRIEVLTQISDNMTNPCSENILKIATEHKVPCFSFVTSVVKLGAFGAVARDYYQNGIDASRLAVRILNGESPGDIPLQLVSKTNLIVNKKVSGEFGIVFPEELISKSIQLE